MSLLDAQEPQGESNFPKPTESPLKKILPFTGIGIVIAALYVAYIFYSRHQSDVEAQARIEQQQQAQRQKAVDTVFGNGEIRFTQFMVDTRSLKRGETANLCYGVENATTVKMDPPLEALKPTYSHCMQISPKVTTKYTITAEDGKGHSKSLSLTLDVH